MPAYLPNREELAWAAGFFDGEGSTVLDGANSRRMRNGVRQDYPTPRVSVAQHGTPPEALMRFRAAVGDVGKIYGPYLYGGYRSPRWNYMLRGFEGAQFVIAQLWPFLCTPKRKQATEALTAFLADKKTRQPYRVRPLVRTPLVLAEGK